MNRPKNARPLKISRAEILVKLDAATLAAIDAKRTEEQTRWQEDLAYLLAGEGIPSDIARYASRHSLEVSTARRKAEKLEEIIKEIQGY